MVWVKLDDGFPDHWKLAELGDYAPLCGWLYICGLAYANRQLTDGKIPKAHVPRLASFRHIGIEVASIGNLGAVGEDIDVEDLAKMLHSVNLWEDHGYYWYIHDYDDYQPTREEIEAEREQKKAAGRAGGLASGRARAKASASPPAQAKSNPVPVPDPVIPFRKPEPRDAAAAAHAPEGLDAVQSAWREAGHEVTPAVTRMMVQDLEAMPLDWVLAAIDEGVQCGARGWKYIRSILERWKHEGRESTPDPVSKFRDNPIIAAQRAWKEANG